MSLFRTVQVSTRRVKASEHNDAKNIASNKRIMVARVLYHICSLIAASSDLRGDTNHGTDAISSG